MDYVILKGLRFHGRHGHFDEERKQGNQFVIDCRLGLETREAGRSDMLSDTVDYSKVYALIEDTLSGSSVHLIETLCEAVADAVLDQHPKVQEVSVCVRKLNPPSMPMAECAGVEILRARS